MISRYSEATLENDTIKELKKKIYEQDRIIRKLREQRGKWENKAKAAKIVKRSTRSESQKSAQKGDDKSQGKEQETDEKPVSSHQV